MISNINSQDREAKWKYNLIQQHKVLFDYYSKTMKPDLADYVDCPLCGTKDNNLLFEKDWFKYFKCRDCSMVYMNPRLTKSATYAYYNSLMNEIYNESKFDKASVTNLLDNQINLSNLDIICQHRNPRGNLLEIGFCERLLSFQSERKRF